MYNPYDFYKLFYSMGYLAKQEVYDACYWGVITNQQYQEITGEEFNA